MGTEQNGGGRTLDQSIYYLAYYFSRKRGTDLGEFGKWLPMVSEIAEFLFPRNDLSRHRIGITPSSSENPRKVKREGKVFAV